MAAAAARAAVVAAQAELHSDSEADEPSVAWPDEREGDDSSSEEDEEGAEPASGGSPQQQRQQQQPATPPVDRGPEAPSQAPPQPQRPPSALKQIDIRSFFRK